MSNAWEVTDDDIRHVLRAHNSSIKVDDDIDVIIDDDRIEDAVLNYDDMEDQVACMYSEIEDMLIEEGYIADSKLFSCP